MRPLFFIFLIIFALFIVPRYLGPNVIIEAVNEGVSAQQLSTTIGDCIQKMNRERSRGSWEHFSLYNLFGQDEHENNTLHLACKAGRLDYVGPLFEYADYYYCRSSRRMFSWLNSDGKTPLRLLFDTQSQHFIIENFEVVKTLLECDNKFQPHNEFEMHITSLLRQSAG